jgi:GDP-L-fucose synthase
MPVTQNRQKIIGELPKQNRIYIAGHRGMVGSAIYRNLASAGFHNLIVRTRDELDLLDQRAVQRFFDDTQIDHVVLAAAKVGGIYANHIYPADFIYQNLMIEANVIHAAYQSGVRRLLFLGSSCIYPKLAKQPITEEELLNGPLEATNEPYAIAKIAGINLCESYNRQFSTRYRAVMPTNLYGPNDNFDLQNSHVLPALIRKFHLAKLATEGDQKGIEKDEALFGPIPDDIRSGLLGDDGPVVRLWGSGKPKREFLHVEDLAAACVLVMGMSENQYRVVSSHNGRKDGRVAGDDGENQDVFVQGVSHLNIGVGEDVTIRELAELVKSVVGYTGELQWDLSKPDGTPQKLLDVTRLKSTGWEPVISLEEGIQRTYQWYNEISSA